MIKRILLLLILFVILSLKVDASVVNENYAFFDNLTVSGETQVIGDWDGDNNKIARGAWLQIDTNYTKLSDNKTLCNFSINIYGINEGPFNLTILFSNTSKTNGDMFDPNQAPNPCGEAGAICGRYASRELGTISTTKILNFSWTIPSGRPALSTECIILNDSYRYAIMIESTDEHIGVQGAQMAVYGQNVGSGNGYMINDVNNYIPTNPYTDTARFLAFRIMGYNWTEDALVISDLYDKTGDGTNKTSDTTPTINLTTNIPATCEISADNSTWFPFSTTGRLVHVGTVSETDHLDLGYPQNVTVNCTDSLLNSEYATIQYNITTSLVSLYLNGVNASRKYEYYSYANITANVTFDNGTICDTCYLCISFDAPDYGDNYSCAYGTTGFIYNITILRKYKFNDSFSTTNITSPWQTAIIFMDNRTDITAISFNISSEGTTSNLTITGEGNTYKFLRGDITGDYLYQKDFVYSGNYYESYNLSYLTKGSKYIYFNNTDHPFNLTFQLTGFDLDKENSFSYIENFNNSDNISSYDAEITTPYFLYDDFTLNVTDRYSSNDFPTNYEIKNSATYSTDTGFMYWKSTKNDPGHVIMDDFDMK
ncbi:MAG: hypothetical protein ACTSX6_04855, partial [Candidatus Heimdallarchaeaceae archaeon]